MEREKITVSLHEWDEDFDVPVAEFVGQLNRLLALIPRGQTAMIGFARNDYDYSHGELSVYYIRDETDEELHARQRAEERAMNERQARELAELARLKAKYPGGNSNE